MTDHPTRSKQEAGYHTGHGPFGSHCGICTMFRAPHGCTLVIGKVNYSDGCKFFERKKGFAEGGAAFGPGEGFKSYAASPDLAFARAGASMDELAHSGVLGTDDTPPMKIVPTVIPSREDLSWSSLPRFDPASPPMHAPDIDAPPIYPEDGSVPESTHVEDRREGDAKSVWGKNASDIYNSELAWNFTHKGFRDFLADALGIRPSLKSHSEKLQPERLIERALGGIAAYYRGGRVSADAAEDLASGLEGAEARTHRNPSEAQKEAGNYRKGKMSWHGETLSIENPKGSTRSGIGKDGKKWSVTLPAAYGYILGTEAVDGDHVDAYVGPYHQARKVYVIHQRDADTKKYDEPKAFLSFPSRESAIACYMRGFSDGKAKQRFGGVEVMSIPSFKAWAKSRQAQRASAKG